jgi:membrane-associated phospholipid phosphatase
VRLRKAIRTTAWGLVAAGIAAPLLRKRIPAPPVVSQAVAYGAPLALAIAAPRSRRRDVAICALQMWAYLAAYKAPHDDEDAQEARVHVDYPIAVDRLIGFGQLPSLRLQRALARYEDGRPAWRLPDRVLVGAHWIWFTIPHATVLYVMVRRPEKFGRAAALTYGVFNTGAIFYWLIPTAPPWYAAESRAEAAQVRRMMVEFGEDFWGEGWESLYDAFGGNPLAAMPSLHFATSLMAATLLAETGPVAGAVGYAYTATLGFALVYLGEHYVTDLIAGAGLALSIRRAAPVLGPAAEGFSRAVANVGEYARGPR